MYTSKSRRGATPDLHRDATVTVVDEDEDDIHVGALLSYLPFPKRIIEFVEDTGLEADLRPGSIVVITHVSTVESATLEDILRRPLSDRIRIARGLFEEAASKGTSHFSSLPGDGNNDDASTSAHTSYHAGRMMFIHYARAMERLSVWREALDSLVWAKNTMGHYAEVVGYWLSSAKRLLCRQDRRHPPSAVRPVIRCSSTTYSS